MASCSSVNSMVSSCSGSGPANRLVRRGFLLQALVKCGASFFGVMPCGAFRRLWRAGQNGLGDGGVFTPDGSADLEVRERRAHAALEVRPQLRNRFGDREIPGQLVHTLMEGNVCLD